MLKDTHYLWEGFLSIRIFVFLHKKVAQVHDGVILSINFTVPDPLG